MSATLQGVHMLKSNDVTQYLVTCYTFHLKYLAYIFSGGEVIQLLHQLCIILKEDRI
jgi:hypothetical protein